MSELVLIIMVNIEFHLYLHVQFVDQIDPDTAYDRLSYDIHYSCYL